jgi:hypothetical protein
LNLQKRQKKGRQPKNIAKHQPTACKLTKEWQKIAYHAFALDNRDPLGCGCSGALQSRDEAFHLRHNYFGMVLHEQEQKEVKLQKKNKIIHSN